MSSSDIFDVLNIQHPKSSSPPSNSGTPGVPRTSKPQVTGIQRELYNLLGDNTPPVVAEKANKFKDKINALSKPSPWTYTEFQATPSLKLRHWVKGSKELVSGQLQQSAFDKYNKKLTIPSFTKEEFESFMNKEDTIGEDPLQWTFEEVEHLFDLCRKYDLRWFIIQDRFNSKQVRSLENIKETFYKVCQQYFLAKEPDNPLISSLNFPTEKEVERKKYLSRLLSRSAAEIAEEEALIIESKKFEMAAKKTLNERESLLRLLDSPNSEKSISQYLTSQGMSQLYNSLLMDKSRKRKHDSVIPENPWMKQQQQFAQQRHQMQQQQQQQQRQQQIDLQQPQPLEVKGEIQNSALNKKTKKQKQEMQIAIKRKADSEYAEQLLKRFTPEERKALGVIAHGEKLSPGVFLRSAKISTFKPAVQNKVQATLQELELPIRPAMPTFIVVHRQEQLLKRIAILLDLKKQLDKLEAEKSITK
ncbi:LAFE_0D02476g1_1 [Lachancea fermentati]|uniref:SWR1-complex protein 4 n=1 Tax=Lachancea fermentati TaxID=4955 RepID=A0A1G4MBA1_LACFM|nr:LAFE_0D02476g1_1 [Lachancea fermentati]